MPTSARRIFFYDSTITYGDGQAGGTTAIWSTDGKTYITRTGQTATPGITPANRNVWRSIDDASFEQEDSGTTDLNDGSFKAPANHRIADLSAATNGPGDNETGTGILVSTMTIGTQNFDQTLTEVFTGRQWKRGYNGATNTPYGPWTLVADRQFARDFTATSVLGANAAAVANLDSQIPQAGDRIANLATLTDGPAGATGAGIVNSYEIPANSGNFIRRIEELGSGAIHTNYWDGTAWGGWQGSATELQAEDLNIMASTTVADATSRKVARVTSVAGTTVGKQDAIVVPADITVDGRTLTSGTWYWPEGSTNADVNDLVRLSAGSAAAPPSTPHTLASLTDTANAEHSTDGIIAGDVFLAASRQEGREEKKLLDIGNNDTLAFIAPDGTPAAGYKKPNAAKIGTALTLTTQTDAAWPVHEPIYYSNLGDTADTITPGAGIQLHNEAGAAVGSLVVDPFSTIGLVKTAAGIVEIISFGDTDANAALTANIDPENLNPGAVEEFEVPFAGAVVGDAFTPASPLDIGSPASGFFQATANYARDDFVRVVIRNNDVVAHDLPTAVWRIYKVNHRLPSPAVAGVQAIVGGTGVTVGGTATNPQIDFAGAAVLERTYAQISAQADSINQAALKTRSVLVYINDRDVYVRPGPSLNPTGPWSESGTTVAYVTPS